MFKNVATTLTLSVFVSSTGLQATGDASNLLFYVDIDDGGPTLIASNSGVPTEISSTHAKGDYKIAVSQAETNGNKLNFTGVSSTSGNVVVSRTYYTFPASFKMGIADGAIADASFTIPTLTGPAVGVVGFIVQLWRRFFKKTIYNITSNNIKTYADDNATVVTTQVTSSTSSAQEVDAAS